MRVCNAGCGHAFDPGRDVAVFQAMSVTSDFLQASASSKDWSDFTAAWSGAAVLTLQLFVQLARVLAKAMKDFGRRLGAELGFSDAPGDCLAFKYYRDVRAPGSLVLSISLSLLHCPSAPLCSSFPCSFARSACVHALACV